MGNHLEDRRRLPGQDPCDSIRFVPKEEQTLAPLAGRVSLVTGSGRRTGRAIARRLARDGASVVLAARTGEELEQAAREIHGEGGDALPVPADVTCEAEVERLFERAVERFGRIDHVVNAAGVYRTGPIAEYSLEDWAATLDTYLTATFLCSREAARRMKGQGCGHIVNISSTLVGLALPGCEAYCAAKAGVEGLSRSLAASLAPEGVKVTVITPGAINASGDDPDPERLLEREDVAAAVSHLLSLPAHVHVPELTLRTVR